jgi:transcriptional regulator with XRE-family HTH domain
LRGASRASAVTRGRIIGTMSEPPATTPAPAEAASPARLAPTRARRGAAQPVGEERARLRATFGLRLWRERYARGWQQATLARAAGYHEHTISHYEAGTKRPSDAACHRLAAALAGPRADAVDVAVLAIDLMGEVGASLYQVQRRRPRRRWARAYGEARRRREADRQAREAAEWDAATVAALALIEPEPAEPWPGRRPEVRQ